MSEIFAPRMLVIVHVIFGYVLTAENFRLREVSELIEDDFGKNAHKVLDRLVKLGWLNVTIDHEKGTGGRPAVNLYTRTQKGTREYRKLVNMLAKYDITLEQKR